MKFGAIQYVAFGDPVNPKTAEPTIRFVVGKYMKDAGSEEIFLTSNLMSASEIEFAAQEIKASVDQAVKAALIDLEKRKKSS